MTVTSPEGSIVLGCKVKDPITGCIGTVVAICHHLHSNANAGIEGTAANGFDKDKRQWFPITRLELVLEDAKVN